MRRFSRLVSLMVLFVFTAFLCRAQVPLTEIEGRLTIYLPMDTTSVHIGKNAGINQQLNAKKKNTYIGTHAGRFGDIPSNNTFVGYEAGANSEDSGNSFFGVRAGLNNDGKQNSFFGLDAGINNIGSSNAFFGDISGQQNDGSYNSFFGSESGASNKGDYNSFFGFEAGLVNEGDYNCFIGNEAGLDNIDGDFNQFIGHKSGYDNVTGDRNIAIGAFALYRAKQKSDNIAIGDSAMYGIGIINENTFFGQRNVAIGTRAFYGVDSEFGRNSVAIGYEAGMDGGQRSVFLGYQAGKNISQLDDVLYIDNRSGENPLIYGEFDNDYVQINGDLESSGKLSIGTNPGNWKVVVRNAGNALSGTNVNVSNLAMMLEKQSPAPNEAVGLGFKSSSDDTDVGAAIIHEKTSNFSKGKMHFATKTSTVPGDDIPIHMTIDDDGQVGIGTLNPVNDLEIDGNAQGGVAGFTRTDLGGSKSHILHGATGDWYIRPSINSGKIVIADKGGNVGIGTDNPGVTLDVMGTIRGTSVFCAGIDLCSDARLKRNFQRIENPTSLLEELNGYFHYWKDEEYPEWEFTKAREIGFKAQEVKEVLPEVVATMPDGYLAIDYAKMVPLLVEAVKEQQAIIGTLETQVREQQAQLEKKDRQFNSLLARIEQLENSIHISNQNSRD